MSDERRVSSIPPSVPPAEIAAASLAKKLANLKTRVHNQEPMAREALLKSILVEQRRKRDEASQWVEACQALLPGGKEVTDVAT